MLRRILLIAAIILAGGAAAVNFTMVKDKVAALRDDRDSWNKKFTETDATLRRTKSDLDKTAADLKKTQGDLASAQKERDDAVAKAAAEKKRGDGLAEQLDTTKKERDTAQAYLERYKATGLEPEQVVALNKQLKEMQTALEVANTEKQVLERTKARIQARLDMYEHPEKFVTAPAGLKGKIVLVDPKWEFVVLDIGVMQGVPDNCEFLVSRNDKLVAKVVVQTVEKNRSIANIVPGWKLGDLFEGDQVMPAHPTPES